MFHLVCPHGLGIWHLVVFIFTAFASIDINIYYAYMKRIFQDVCKKIKR